MKRRAGLRRSSPRATKIGQTRAERAKQAVAAIERLTKEQQVKEVNHSIQS